MKANIELYMESVWGSIFNIPLVDVTNATTPVEPFPILKYMEMNNIIKLLNTYTYITTQS